ncbi:hypothetical protein HQQ94_20775 [Shewanella sp. VB17]|uniref:hypothetical protein n=1 Tax=Shewanella sp. VB17 TaxID=2739432 RepID=UPI0015656EF5|nr:hypothetical protein [Shewanella sp. VB17]NRD75609.1 hypothetical protein [Shewanella sp. VB17]
MQFKKIALAALLTPVIAFSSASSFANENQSVNNAVVMDSATKVCFDKNLKIATMALTHPSSEMGVLFHQGLTELAANETIIDMINVGRLEVGSQTPTLNSIVSMVIFRCMAGE